MLFQAMFAVITPALISGAIVERVRIKAYVLFIALWSVVVYAPVAHWVWAPGGWLRRLGELDFAGGKVVHIKARPAALLFARVLGPPAGLASLTAVRFRPRLGLDDSLDVFAVHGVAATLGALLTGVLASKGVNPDGADGSLHLLRV